MTRTDRPWLAVTLMALAGLTPGSTATAQAPPELKTFDLGDFRLESGQVLLGGKLAYTTRGSLNAAKTNAILLPSPYSGDHTSYDFLVGPGKALDPAVYFLVATNQLGNGKSSSPSNTPGAQHGADFPAIAIRDDVEATHRLVAQGLGIDKLLAVVGFSMGGQQAMQWAVSFPEGMCGVVNLCGSAREYPFGFVRLEGAKGAILADPTFEGGRYTKPPVAGLKALGAHWVAWAYSPEWWRDGEYKKRGGTIEKDGRVVEVGLPRRGRQRPALPGREMAAARRGRHPGHGQRSGQSPRLDQGPDPADALADRPVLPGGRRRGRGKADPRQPVGRDPLDLRPHRGRRRRPRDRADSGPDDPRVPRITLR